MAQTLAGPSSSALPTSSAVPTSVVEEVDEAPRQVTETEKAGASAALRIFASCPPPGGMVRWHGKATDLGPVVAAFHVANGKFTGPKRFKRAAAAFLLTPDGQNASVGFYTRFVQSEAARCAFVEAADAAPPSSAQKGWSPQSIARPPPPRITTPHEYRGKSMQLVEVAGGTMTSEI